MREYINTQKFGYDFYNYYVQYSNVLVKVKSRTYEVRYSRCFLQTLFSHTVELMI